MDSKIVILTASSGKNLELARILETELIKRNTSSIIVNLTTVNTLLYTPETAQNGVPDEFIKQAELLKQASGFVVLAPEYNGSIPPVLTNYFAWLSLTSKNWRDCFNAKPALIGTHSGSGGLHCLTQLRSQLAYMGVNVIGRQLHTNYSKPLNMESVEACLSQLLAYTRLHG